MAALIETDRDRAALQELRDLVGRTAPELSSPRLRRAFLEIHGYASRILVAVDDPLGPCGPRGLRAVPDTTRDD